MDLDSWPAIPRDLMDRLDKMVPERSPMKGESFEDLMRRGAQRELIRVLWAVFTEQNRSILKPQDSAYVPSD